MNEVRVVVIGQLARDLVLLVDEMPEPGAAADVRLRREMLGGKGANQAVAAAQLGSSVALVAVAGDDRVGDDLLAQAREDGIDVSGVVRRPGATTGLIVEALDHSGQWQYLQHLPDEVLLRETDVIAAEDLITGAHGVLVQLQQPTVATLAAARSAQAADRFVVLDGAPREDEHRSALLAAADVVRTDARETRLLTGRPTDHPDLVRRGAAEILSAGPRLLALGLESGNLFIWNDPHWGTGDLLLPLTEDRTVDTTGAGDALVAALTVSLLRGEPPASAARFAVAAAASSVKHPGGRPELRRHDLDPVRTVD
jgi:ribokinase